MDATKGMKTASDLRRIWDPSGPGKLMVETSNGQHEYHLRENYQKEGRQGPYSGANCAIGKGWAVVRRTWLVAKKVKATRLVNDRKELVDKGNRKLSIKRQYKLLSILRSLVDYWCKEQRNEKMETKRLLNEINWMLCGLVPSVEIFAIV